MKVVSMRDDEWELILHYITRELRNRWLRYRALADVTDDPMAHSQSFDCYTRLVDHLDQHGLPMIAANRDAFEVNDRGTLYYMLPMEFAEPPFERYPDQVHYIPQLDQSPPCEIDDSELHQRVHYTMQRKVR
jgi:hypothetical protein